MSYADFDYYTNTYLGGLEGIVPESAFAFFAKEASKQIDVVTFGNVKELDTVPTEVKDCCCRLAEFLYDARQAEADQRENGGVLKSYSNDGQSATVEMRAAFSNEAARRKEIGEIIGYALQGTGLLYAGSK